MLKYIVIATDDDSYRITALISDNGSYVMPSFDMVCDAEVVDSWDNEGYLMQTLYPYLQGVVDNDELDDVLSNVKDSVLEIFEEAIKTGIFKLNN